MLGFRLIYHASEDAMTTNISFEDVKYSRKQLNRMLKNTHTLESINSAFINLNSRKMDKDRPRFIYRDFHLSFLFKTEELKSKQMPQIENLLKK